MIQWLTRAVYAYRVRPLKIELGPIMRETPIHLPCFGRAADLERLADRVRRRGVTFVMAQPRMGKTWLVRNLAFQWAARQEWNVGYAQSSGGKNDLLRDVVADLYKRWLDGANVVDQANSLWERHKGGLVGKVGGAVGKLLGKIAALADGDWVGAQKLIDQTFDALTSAERDLRSGGMTLAPITYEDARDLVGIVAKVTSQPILLVMDAWEQGLDLTGNQGSIRKLMDNEEDWPESFHLLLVIRDLPKHLKEVRFADECSDTHPSAGLFPVDRLDLHDLKERDRLLFFLRDKVPAVSDADQDWVIEQCTYPAVIEWWIARRPPDRDALHAEAANALNNALNDAKAEEDLPRRDALLIELRQLAQAHPEDAAVREILANGLYNTLVDAKAEEDRPRRDALLIELRQLAQAHPEDAAVREWLAKGLFNTLVDAKAEEDLPRRDALLIELRQLTQAHPEDAAVRQRLAKGLVMAWSCLGDEGDAPKKEALLVELRELLDRYADDERLAQFCRLG